VNEREPAPRSHVPFAWLIDWWLRSWRRVALMLLVLAGAVLVVRAVATIWIGYRLHHEIVRLEKLYGRLDPATLAPPRVAPAENRARAMRAAANLTVVDGPSEEAFLTGGVAVLSRGEKSIEENRLAVQVAEQGRRRPRSNWEIDYAHNDANFPRLLDVRSLGVVLAATCRVHLDAGRGNEAAGAALAGLAEASSLSNEPVLIIQLIRIAVAQGQFECVRDLLQRGDPSAGILAELSRSLAENRSPDPMRNAFIGELKHVNKTFGDMERGRPGAYNVGVGGGIGHSPAPWPIVWLARPLIRSGQLRYLQQMERLIDLQAVPPFARRPADAGWLTIRRAHWWEFARQFDTLFLPGLQRADESGYEYQSVLNAAEVAVALRRFRVERGSYPGALAALVPGYLPKLPIDPFTGRPPDYKQEGTGFDLRAHGAGRFQNKLLEWKIPR
jgi:hypothetical protein